MSRHRRRRRQTTTGRADPPALRSFFFSALLPLILYADAHVFVYHRFDDARHPSTSTSLSVLKAQFEYLKQHDYQVIPLSRLSKALRNKEPINPRWVVLTVDDNYKSFYENALPLFKAYGYPFTLFVYVEATDKGYGDFMSWEQIKEIEAYGEIGLHGYGHRHEVHLAPHLLKEETEKAIRSYAKQLKRIPHYYAYPYGEYNPSVKTIIASYGFDLILNQTAGAVSETSDPLDLDRIALIGENLLEEKLKIRRLDAQWFTPVQWPLQGRLNEIHAKIAPTYKTAELFITGEGWQRIPVENGVIRATPDITLSEYRTRLFIKVGDKQNGIILVKE